MTVLDDTPIVNSAQMELSRGLGSMLRIDLRREPKLPADDAIVREEPFAPIRILNHGGRCRQKNGNRRSCHAAGKRI